MDLELQVVGRVKTHDGVHGTQVTGVPWDLDGWPHVLWEQDDYLCVMHPNEIEILPDTSDTPIDPKAAGVSDDPSDSGPTTQTTDSVEQDSQRTRQDRHPPEDPVAHQAVDASQ